jgi:hypothetical protein
VPCELEIDLNAEVNLTHSNGTAITNYDGTLAAVTADTDVTFPATDAAGNSIPDDARYEYAILQLVGGTGAGQFMFLTTKTGVRKFGFVDAYTPVNPSTDTQYLVLGSWRASAVQAEGTVLTGTVESTGTTTTNIVLKTISPALTDTDQLKGRVILFRTDTATAALRGQGAPIDGSTTTAITLAAGDALTTTPAEDDSFVIV